ncbi:MAG: SDR family oxidoreductase [Polyangiaceae bacterium]
MSERRPDRVALVTGASSGIGAETARGLARAGYHVVVVGRNSVRTREVAESIRTAGYSAEHVLADFSSLEQVREVAKAFEPRHPRLHVLVNNAGLWHPDRRLSQDGHEETFAVNHLAPFLLTRLLEGKLISTPGARVVTVSSRLHIKPPSFDFADVMSEQKYEGIYVYSKSKLANVLFSNELARRLKCHGVTSNSVHPGSVVTNVVRDSRFLSWGASLPLPWLKSPVEGARPSLFVATSPTLSGVTGCYFASSSRGGGRDTRAHVPSRAALDVRAAEQLWALSDRLVARFL